MVYQGYYKFETLTTDYSSAGNTLTQTGTVTQVPGRYGVAASAGSTPNHNNYLYKSSITINPANGWNITGWVKILAQTATTSAYRYIASFIGTTNTTNCGVAYGKSAGGVDGMQFRLGGNLLTYNITLTVGARYFFSNTPGNQFLNTTRIGTTNYSNSNGFTNGVCVFSFASSPGNNAGCACEADTISFDNTTWSQAKIRTIYMAQSGIF